jgi:hypothetical protein
MEEVEWTKVKYAHRGTLRNPFEHNLNINNKRQYCKIGTVCGGTSGRRRVNEGD